MNLQRVIDVVTERYGEVSSLFQLMEAFLFAGQFAQVRKLMDTPGLRYRQEPVNMICNGLIANNQLEALDKFVSLSKNVFGCDREYLYKRLLEAHKEDAEKVGGFCIIC